MASTNVYSGIDPYLVKLVRHHACRVASSDSRLEQEDIEQELFLHLHVRSAHYDSSRASRPTFEDRIVRNRAATLIRDARASKRGHSATTISFDEYFINESVTRETTSGERRFSGDSTSDVEMARDDLADLRLDLDRFLKAQPRRLKECCLLLADRPVTNVARIFGCHRSSIYAWLTNLRSKASSAGLEIYLHDSPTLSAATR